MIGEDDSRNREAGRYQDFESISFDRSRNRANDGKLRQCVVIARSHDQSRAAARLLMAGDGIEIDPNDVAALRYVARAQYSQRSLPTSGPQSVSG